MGYCMTLKDVNFFIAKENKEKALEAIKALASKVNELGHGGSWAGGKKIDANYSWVDTSEFLNAKTLEDAILAWGWSTDTDKDGNINYIGFDSEKLGDEPVLFEAIAPFVKNGSYIEMSGEDGNIWRWVFDGETMREKAARIVYDC